jgi:hypothetical protein
MIKQRLNRDIESKDLFDMVIETFRSEVKMLPRELAHLLSQPLQPLEDEASSTDDKTSLQSETNTQPTDQSSQTGDQSQEPQVIAFADLPTEVKQGIRLRDEFPFLKDSDCPALLKILVADKLTAFGNYRDAHANLFKEGITPEEFENSARLLVENYLENRLIYDELVHYKETKQILGKHPIFKREQVINELNNLSEADKVKKINNLRTYFSRDSKKLNELNPDDPAYQSLFEKVENWRWQLTVLGDVQN